MTASTARKERPKAWLNSTEAAEYIGVHPSTLGHWRESRIGPAFQRYDSGPVRYRRADLDAYLSRTRFAGVAPLASDT